ncbi:hypothetical protein [Flammeovirga sp. EKP202]|uniref:glycoside hydrolase family 78 protein n=1 Tax=Flammeovirga sp. EKP202 TaxID=2770592 RepID=UPI00165F3A56|nr:hypothetical protein [Flammeovirga sp. EKP202]MBD0404685.1 hypothetical protein [Flammeovirga sp. EKP202]
MKDTISKLLLLFLFIMVVFATNAYTQVKVNELRCEYRENPLGIYNIHPRLSWKLIDQKGIRGQIQTACQVLVASTLKHLNKNIGDVWDSEKVISNQAVNTIYSGKALTSNQNCYWKVRVWDVNGKVSKWSVSDLFTRGVLQSSDW